MPRCCDPAGRGVPARFGPILWLACCLTALVSWGPAAALAGPEAVRVVRVFDGDTCQLDDGRRLRLSGIDAPETSHDGAPAQYFADASADLLARLTRGQALRFVPVGEGRDRFGRLLGELLLADGTSVGERMLAEGAAFYFWHADLPRTLSERALVAERRAMAAGAGFWPRILALPAPPGPYVGNAASRRFHAPGCPHAGKISPRNRVALPTLAEAFGQGFAPARECTPWPAAAGRPSMDHPGRKGP